MITPEDINEIVHRINDQVTKSIKPYVDDDHPIGSQFYLIDWSFFQHSKNIIMFSFLGHNILDFDLTYDKDMSKTELEYILKTKILEIKNVFSKIKLRIE